MMDNLKDFEKKYHKLEQKLLNKEINGDKDLRETMFMIGDLIHDLAKDHYKEDFLEELKSSGRITPNSTVVVKYNTLLTNEMTDRKEKDLSSRFGCKVVVIDGSGSIEGVFNPEIYIKDPNYKGVDHL